MLFLLFSGTCSLSMRRLKNLLVIGLVVILALLTFAIFSFHPDEYREQLSRWASRQGWQLNYQRSVWDLRHPFDWQIEQLTLTQPNTFEASALRVNLQIDPLALFSGKLKIDELKLIAPSVTLGAAKLSAFKPLSLPLFKTIELPHVELQSAQILIHTAKAEDAIQLSESNWILRDLLLTKSQGQWHFSGQIDGNSKKLQLASLKLHDARWQLHPQAGLWLIDQFQASLAAGELRANGQWQAGKLQLEQLSLAGMHGNIDKLDTIKLPNWPQWLKQLNIATTTLSQLNLQTTFAKQPLVINGLDGRILQLSGTGDQNWQGHLQLAINNMLLGPQLLEQVQLSATLQPSIWSLDEFNARFNGGDLGLALSYHWPQQSLRIDELSLKDSELSLSAENTTVWQQLNLAHYFRNIDVVQANIDQLKVVVTLPDIALSTQGIQGSISHLTLRQNAAPTSLAQLWHSDSSLFLQAPALAYHGVIFSHLGVDIGPEPVTEEKTQAAAHLNLYAELPQGQLQWQSVVNLKAPELPWQGQLSALVLDISPLARLTPAGDFKLGGDFDLRGEFQGHLNAPLASVNGDWELKSSQLAFNRDLAPFLESLLRSPKQQFTAEQNRLQQGVSALWQSGSPLPSGATVLHDLDLTGSIKAGELQLPESLLPSAPYNWQLGGGIDLANGEYHNWSLAVMTQHCQLLSRISNGNWKAPQIQLEHYQLKQPFQLPQGIFEGQRLSSNLCPPTAVLPAPTNNP